MSADIVTGSCHCGAVRYEITRPRGATVCNCSLCRRLAALWVYAPPVTGRVIAEPDATIAYSRGDKTLAFHSCKTCGATTHWASLTDDRFAVNLRLADDPDVMAATRVRHFDGAESWTFLD